MPTKILTAFALTVTLATAASTARADEPAPTSPAPSADARWYGYQTLATDAAATGLLALAIVTDSEGARAAFLTASGATYAGAPTAIHAVHGHGLRAAGDLALRLLLPTAGTALGVVIGGETYQGNGDDLGFGALAAAVAGGVIGFGLGVAGAMAIDASVLAWDDAPAEPKEKQGRPSATIAPAFAPTRSGFAAGLTGTF